MTSRKKASITNHARYIYEEFFDSCRRETYERKQYLSQFLSTFMPSDSDTILMKPPDTLNNNKERERWCKEEFREYFYEWLINNSLLGHTKKYSEGLKGHKKGGGNTGRKTNIRSNSRKEPIIQKRKELIDSGVKDEKEIIKRIKKAFPKESYDYIQKTILVEKRKNGGSYL